MISRHGQIPRVEAIEVTPAGQRVRLRMPAGFSSDEIEAVGPALAATDRGPRGPGAA